MLPFPANRRFFIVFFLFSRVLLNRNFFRFCTKSSKTRPLYSIWHGKDFWRLHLCAWSSSYLNAYLLNKSPKEVWKIHTKVVLDYGSQKMSLWCTRHRCWVIRASVSDSPNSPRNWSILPESAFFNFCFNFSRKIFRENSRSFSRKIFSGKMKKHEKIADSGRIGHFFAWILPESAFFELEILYFFNFF